MSHETKTPNKPWQKSHDELCRIARCRAGLDHEEAHWLVVAYRAKNHLELGYGSFIEYVDRVCGYKPRQAKERLRVALALETLPVTREALAGGVLKWSTVRELCRVVTCDTEQAWVDAARNIRVRQIEKMVALAEPGDLPGDPPGRSTKNPVRLRVLRFEVSPETYATYREAVAHLQRQMGQHLDEDDAILAMSRQILNGPTDEGRASYQIDMTVCPECRSAKQVAKGEAIPVGPEIGEMAECDAVLLPVANAHCDCDDDQRQSAPKRATQNIPPAIRRPICVTARRDGKCTVPGCANAIYLDLHHVHLRSEGGDHDPEFLLTLCSCHHRLAHRGSLLVEGSASEGFRFLHADGTPYGDSALCAESAGVYAEAFLALKSLGFGESESRAALKRVPRDTPAEVPLVVRAALRILRPVGVGEARPSYNTRGLGGRGMLGRGVDPRGSLVGRLARAGTPATAVLERSASRMRCRPSQPPHRVT